MSVDAAEAVRTFYRNGPAFEDEEERADFRAFLRSHPRPKVKPPPLPDGSDRTGFEIAALLDLGLTVEETRARVFGSSLADVRAVAKALLEERARRAKGTP